jgi:hypothetical protein
MSARHKSIFRVVHQAFTTHHPSTMSDVGGMKMDDETGPLLTFTPAGYHDSSRE